MKETISLAVTLRKDADLAIGKICEECARLREDVSRWVTYSLGIAVVFAQAGMEDDFVLGFLNRVGPIPGFEEDWRLTRIRVLQELDVQRGASPGALNMSALVEVAEALASAGVERRTAYRHAVKQSRSSGLVLREPRLELSALARSQIQSIVRPDAQ